MHLVKFTCTCWSGASRSRNIFRSVMQHGLSPNFTKNWNMSSRGSPASCWENMSETQSKHTACALCKPPQPIPYLAAVIQDSSALGAVWWAPDGPGTVLSDASTLLHLPWPVAPPWSRWTELQRRAPPLLHNCNTESNTTACMRPWDRMCSKRHTTLLLCHRQAVYNAVYLTFHFQCDKCFPS